jgi:hypothetical protein
LQPIGTVTPRPVISLTSSSPQSLDSPPTSPSTLPHMEDRGSRPNHHVIGRAPSSLDPWSEPDFHTRRTQCRVTSHPVAASCSGTMIPHARGAGLGREWNHPLSAAYRSQPKSRSTRPDPARPARPRGLPRPLRRPGQAALSLAPSGTTPSVTNRHRATRSFLANATMATRRTRPRSDRTRSRNQRLRAVSG